MKRIQTLGGLAVFDGARPLGGNAQQPRRLAILAVLARAGDRGVNRDRLAALLWGDVEEERARRSLNQALYALRQELGSEEAILGTRELRLNPELIEVDLAAFDTARASGALEEAARLYAGPFLGDFHLPGVPAFAHWADEEREGLAAEYRALLEAAAAGATAHGDRGAAVLWWRRLAALDPTDTRAAQGLMRALAVSGDAPGALRHADIVHQIRQQELELAPDPEVAALAERIRRGELAPPTVAPGSVSSPAPAAGDAPAARAPAPPAPTAVAPAESARPVSAPVPAPPSNARRRRAFGLVIVVLLAGVAAGLYWRSGPRVAGSSAPRRLAVLPFQNQGDSADAYFADGVTDELRGKLAALPGLEVVASVSSNDYRGSTRRLPEIARELGVDYLLVGKIRWQRGPAGSSRVRVSPELIRLASGTTPTTRWQQPIDAALTDVFAVQAEIATKVADALGVVLGDSARRELTVKPTESLAAYDEFLKGEAASQTMKADQAGLRSAIAFYERAVALDSTFAQAWSQLSRARTSLYSNGVPDPELGEQARIAAERARALRPTEPLAYLAVGDFYGSVNPIDNAKAVAAYERGLSFAPDDVDLLGALSTAETSMGRWDAAPARLARAARLDPRSTTTARRLAAVHIFLRQYAAADSAADRAIALAPTSPAMVSLKLMVAIARGDLDSARAIVRAAAERIDPAALYPFFAGYQDMYWVLDDAQQRQVLASAPSAFDDDRGSWGLVQAELSELRGDRRRATDYADSARLALEEQSRAAPDDGQRHALLGLALAYLGRKADAVREGLRGVALMPISRDAYFGPYNQLQLVRIYLLTGEPEHALDQLEPLLRIPYYLSPGWLRLDPTFEPLRTHPRFRRLLAAGG
ncbi:MAG TPA: BTAD domain-containing putative transcriptional regulator [Gemmatimonadales bacterium]|nr:BTAD domain-containing putative transcriptional regulator [Gemmatimonadales bacterium]